MKSRNQMWNKLSTTQIIALGFMGTILLGACLLMLPFSAAEGQTTHWIDALFTSTTSICVTGLTTVTTAFHWSTFGKVVIMLLSQLGGLGVMTVAILFMVFLGKRITLRERIRVQESYNLENPRGIVRLLIRILKGTLVVEGIGAFFFAFQFIPQFGFWRGIGYSVFHAVSAFCNAGLDIVGDSSFRNYATNPLINFTTMFLIIVAGIGFPVWWDVVSVIKESFKNKRRKGRIFSRLKLHSKVAISTTVILLGIGFIIVFLCEYHNPDTIGEMSLGNKMMASMFQSVTTRTAGFESIPQGKLTNGSALTSLILMFIGGSPAGTAGGVKTTTVAMLALSVMASIKGRKDIEAFGRKIAPDNLRTGLSVTLISFSFLMISTMLLFIVEDFSFLDTFYETVSSIGTVGLTRGITSKLSTVGKLIIIFTMYLGRIGPITMAMAFMVKRSNRKNLRELPTKSIIIG